MSRPAFPTRLTNMPSSRQPPPGVRADIKTEPYSVLPDPDSTSPFDLLPTPSFLQTDSPHRSLSARSTSPTGLRNQTP